MLVNISFAYTFFCLIIVFFIVLVEFAVVYV